MSFFIYNKVNLVYNIKPSGGGIMDFKMNINKYNFFVKNIIFNEPKKEKEIFDLLVKGYNANEIGVKIGMCERTVYRRKNELKKKMVGLF